MRLSHAFLMSHITYVAAMHCWQNHEKAELHLLIRKSIKCMLGIPMNASPERPMQLGVHNTLEEIIKAQHTAQTARLSSLPAGREILAFLGCNPSLEKERKVGLTRADSYYNCLPISPQRTLAAQWRTGEGREVRPY